MTNYSPETPGDIYGEHVVQVTHKTFLELENNIKAIRPAMLYGMSLFISRTNAGGVNWVALNQTNYSTLRKDDLIRCFYTLPSARMGVLFDNLDKLDLKINVLERSIKTHHSV